MSMAAPRSVNSLSRFAKRSSSVATAPVIQTSKRWLHESRSQHAIMMPAMSPLMSVGTVKRWKKREGEAFVPGDVLLQIESDIAMIDVQAENAGIITKILIPDGTTNVPVEKVIALVARDKQEYARLLAQPHLQEAPSPPYFASSPTSPSPSPSSPSGRRSPSPIPFDQLSPSRSPNSKRSSPFRHQTHFTTTSNPSTHANTGAVRGMVTNHVRTTSLPPSPVHIGRTEANEKTPNEQMDGASLRRMIVTNLSRHSASSSPEKSTKEYFEGIL